MPVVSLPRPPIPWSKVSLAGDTMATSTWPGTEIMPVVSLPRPPIPWSKVSLDF